MERKHLIGYPIVAIIAILITYFCIKGLGPVIPSEPTTPKEIISFKDATQLYRSYTENRACLIDLFEKGEDSLSIRTCNPERKTNPNFVPSRSFFLSKEFLEEYIAYVKEVSSENGVKDITGYRLYLGNYPQDSTFVDGKPIPDPGRNTFFIAPTKLVAGSNLHRGFTFVKDNNDKPKIIFLEDTLTKSRSSNQGFLQRQKSNLHTASFFSFYLTNPEERLSTIANDLGSYP